MGLQKKDASKANIATENAGNLPNLLSVQRQRNGADKTGISIGNTRSLSLWRTLAKEKKLEECRQRLSEKQHGNIKETTLSRAMGLPHVKEWQTKAQGSSVDDVSQTSTNCSSDDVVNQRKALLWVSEPRFEGDTTRQFALTIGRSSIKQRLGLSFAAKEYGKMIIAEDAKQFGLVKGDVVLGINGCSKSLTVENTMRILNSSLQIELSVLRIAHESQIQGKPLTWHVDRKMSEGPWSTRQGVRCVDLLAVSPQQPLPAGPEDQFTITLCRATCHMKFGLELRSVSIDPTGHSLTSKVYCAENMPHLGLKKDDQILSINGHSFTNFTECQHLLDAGMGVELLLKRNGKKASAEPNEWKPEKFRSATTIEMNEENEEVEATVEHDWMVPPHEWDEPIVRAPKRSIL